MKLLTYICGSFYIIQNLFRISNKLSNYFIEKKYFNISKFEKINECIYSSLHSLLITITSSLSFKNRDAPFQLFSIQQEKDNEMQYLTSSICLSYFVIDLLRCIYYKKYLFIIHHVSAINLLLFNSYALYNGENKGFYAMYMIFLLESNTILLNIGFLLKEFKFHYSITCLSWIIHLFFFFIFRLITFPKLLFIYYYTENHDFIRMIEFPNFLLIFFGSVYWSYRQSIGIHKYLKENSVI
jgi:hypothetical protein